MITRNHNRRCLIVERHEWETGGREQQLQIPLGIAREFFGEGDASRDVTVRLFQPPTDPNPIAEKEVSISATYQNATRRVNGFVEVGLMPSCFLFFEETAEPNTYDVWCVEDKAIVSARFNEWQQGANSQHGRGRLAAIVAAPVTRDFATL